MAKYIVQAVARQGYDGLFRAGYKWSSAGPTEVEVVDSDEDPPREPGKGIRLGRTSWKAIMEDAQLTKLQAGDPLAAVRASTDIEALRKEVERLTNENASLKARLGEGDAAKEQAVVRNRSKREE